MLLQFLGAVGLVTGEAFDAGWNHVDGHFFSPHSDVVFCFGLHNGGHARVYKNY